MGKIKDLIDAPKQATTIAVAAIFIAVTALVVALMGIAHLDHKISAVVWAEGVR